MGYNLECLHCGAMQAGVEHLALEMREFTGDENDPYYSIPLKCEECEEAIVIADIDWAPLEPCRRFVLSFDFGKNLNHTHLDGYIPTHPGESTDLLPELLQCVAEHLEQEAFQGGMQT